MSEVLGLKNINMLSKEQYNGVSDIAKDELYAISGSGFGFPSDRYDDLELGASGTQYTAPANGYFYLGKVSTGNNQLVDMYNLTTKYRFQTTANSGIYCLLTIPARKGDKVEINFTTAGATEYFRFIYAEGE